MTSRQTLRGLFYPTKGSSFRKFLACLPHMCARVLNSMQPNDEITSEPLYSTMIWSDDKRAWGKHHSSGA